MKKHLREQLIPPDHINTSLSAGTSEVIEVMLTKRREDRYNNAEELLVDLEAIRDGQPPLRAHKRFDFSVLEQLEEGDAVDIEQEQKVYKDETVARYQIAILVLSAVAAVSIVVILLLVLRFVS
jgi:serine/threonine-protein kinase